MGPVSKLWTIDVFAALLGAPTIELPALKHNVPLLRMVIPFLRPDLGMAQEPRDLKLHQDMDNQPRNSFPRI